MRERKHKRTPESFIELDSEELGFVLEDTEVEVGSGYTLSVNHDEKQRPIVDVKTYGQVDFIKLRKEIERLFPNAQIRQQNRIRSVTIVKKKEKKRPFKKK